ncbi:DHH family phosphoesterase [Candidatus Thorarchaeota archaeon]|nr:MAG: DHH family phosphoesterase [Candidatus Thorarchaeota archaeon]
MRGVLLHRMEPMASKCADLIKQQSVVHVVSHIDADGLTSAAILCTALERAGINYSVDFIRQLTDDSIKSIAAATSDLVIFTDLGSGMIEKINEFGIKAIVCDHHVPAGDCDFHLNPRVYGINGTYDLSGSGTTFVLANALDSNSDLANLAIVGAVGDLQHMKLLRLTGVNKEIVNLGVANGSIICEKDLMFFGKQTRAVHKMLQYNSDPYIPGLSGNSDACIQFVKDAGVHMHGEKWLRWIDMQAEEKQRIIASLVNHCVSAGISGEKINRLVGEVYTFPRETEGTEMRDASEYSTLLNATARYNKASVGLGVCMGDRGTGYERAKVLLGNHRKNLVDGITLVKKQGVTKMKHFQYFDSGSKIQDTIVGIIAGMSYSIVGDRSLPIIAFADTPGGVKVSGRGTYDLVRKGLNLAAAMSSISSSLGGSGGGHDIAAGAYIPSSAKAEFIIALDIYIGDQMK